VCKNERVYSCVFVCIRVYSCVVSIFGASFKCIRVYSCVFVRIRVYSCVFVCIFCPCVFRGAPNVAITMVS